jgi:hypothetical protein
MPTLLLVENDATLREKREDVMQIVVDEPDDPQLIVARGLARAEARSTSFERTGVVVIGTRPPPSVNALVSAADRRLGESPQAA